MRILVAEDEPLSRRLLEGTLEALGHEVATAGDGNLAWSRFRIEHYPIVITDRDMPGLDGLELCRRIRADPRPRYTFVVVLTATGGKDDFLAGMRAGADDFMVKPLDPVQLEARLLVAERVLRLQTDLRTLEGMLPICSYCRRVREGRDYWQKVEAFVESRTEAKFSHSICPDCYREHVVPELEALRKAREGTVPRSAASGGTP